MAQTALDVANLGISKGGGEKIADFAENTSMAAFALEEYPAKRRFLLGLHRWVFAKRVVQLQQIVLPAGAPYAFAFQRPIGLVGGIHDFRQSPDDRSPKVHVLQLADYIAGDDQVVWAEFTADVPEGQWDPAFTELVATAFAEEVAKAKMRASAAANLHVEAFGTPEQGMRGGLMELAMNTDGRNAPKRTLEWEGGGALVEARVLGANGIGDPRLAQALTRALGG